MMRALRPLLFAAGGLCVAGAQAVAAGLEPYQMVRSLQLVQDRLADGDQAAMPMQRKLLEIIDAGLRGATPDQFADRKNFRALFVYAMSGGNPETVRTLLTRLDLKGDDAVLAGGVIAYMAGAYGATRKRLEHVDPLALSPEIGAFVALIRGAVLVQESPQQALALFDDARLLAPGTLVEEAALRRSISVAAEIGDTGRFLSGSSQYVRRFLHSPYASQFAEAFVSGVVALHDKLDLPAVAEIVSGMDATRAHAIYLRVARQSAIDGYQQLLDFASAKADQSQSKGAAGEDPRALLYSTVASVTSTNVDEVRTALASIDRSRLSPGDQKLLDAARRVAEQVLARPAPAAPDGGDPAPVASAAPPAAKPATASPAHPAVTAGAPAPAQTIAAAEAPGGAAAQPTAIQPQAAPGAHIQNFVTATRDQLAEIDKLLEETGDE